MRLSPVAAHRVAALAALACACLTLTPFASHAVDAAETGAETAPMKAAMAEYRKKLAAYTKAYDAFDKIAGPYWRAVTDKRSRRRTKVANNIRLTAADYVMTQPPVYTGPGKPDNPLQPGKQRSDIPDVTDFLANAEAEFGFVPEGPADEVAYKRAYAKVAAAAGLTKEAAVKIYGFELGGNGTTTSRPAASTTARRASSPRRWATTSC